MYSANQNQMGAVVAKKVNARWFQDRLADKKLSQRGFAKLIDLDPAALTYAIHGKRDWKHDELVAFATITGTSFEEALVNAGLSLPAAGSKGMCNVTGTVDAAGRVHFGPVAAPRRVPVPPDAGSATAALRFKTPNTAAELMDGWLVYYATDVQRVPPEAIGRLCVAWMASGALLAVVRKGYVRGTFNVEPWVPSGVLVENATVDRAAPVLWVRM